MIRRLRYPALVVIGVTTPLGVLAVNGAAFVMQHLAEFRAVIAAAALVSSLLLNGMVAFSAVRFSRRNAPLLFAEYRRVVVALAAVLVVVTAVGGAYLTYLGMDNAKQLPNRAAILASVLMLGLPFAATYLDRRFLRRREIAVEMEAESEADAKHRQGRRRR